MVGDKGMVGDKIVDFDKVMGGDNDKHNHDGHGRGKYFFLFKQF